MNVESVRLRQAATEAAHGPWVAVSVSADDLHAALDRLEAAEAAVERVRGLTTDTDGNEWEHASDECEGEPECPACWALDVRHAIAPRLSASGVTETKDGE